MKIANVRGIFKWLRVYCLYHKAFPVSEKKPFGMIVKAYKQGKADVWYIESKGHFAGLAITLNYKDMVLLDYFAISEKMRGKGIGALALKYLQKMYEGKKFFLEIESVYEECSNLEERKRRKRFYIVNGMTPMGVRVNLFGVNMELLGYNCYVDFDRYKRVYTGNYGGVYEKMVKKGE